MRLVVGIAAGSGGANAVVKESSIVMVSRHAGTAVSRALVERSGLVRDELGSVDPYAGVFLIF